MKGQHRKAFTQIELIFVMVVIGILAAVSIPRLASSRDDAHGAKCTQEAQQLITEITQRYNNDGYSTFSNLPIEEITNNKVGATSGDGVSSALGTKVSEGITYMCEDEDIVEIKGELSNGTEYNLTVTDLNPTTPAPIVAAKLIRKLNNISTAGGSRIYVLH
jgi:prepilin-type N-terminal cleavage/methylation domain-containing protein